eukprot:10515430-Alexandrium_andersonii.AAC.1
MLGNVFQPKWLLQEQPTRKPACSWLCLGTFCWASVSWPQNKVCDSVCVCVFALLVWMLVSECVVPGVGTHVSLEYGRVLTRVRNCESVSACAHACVPACVHAGVPVRVCVCARTCVS